MALLPGFPAPLAELIQTNKLSDKLSDGLRPNSTYGREAEPKELPPGVGQTMTNMRLGMFDVSLIPANPSGAIGAATFNVEQYTANPQPYANKFETDALTAYVQVGNYWEQGVSRLAEWGSRTRNRLARGKLFAYAGGQSMVRRAVTTSQAVVLVNSLAGFRYTYPGGIPTPVSGSAPLSVMFVAATTFTALVTGVRPLDARYPNGPGELTLSANASAAIAAGSYVKASNAQTVLRAANRASSDAITASDIPVLRTLTTMKSTLLGRGVLPHPSTGSYHLHHDETFLPPLLDDAAFQRLWAGAQAKAIGDLQGQFLPSLGITFFENNDSPAYGKGHEYGSTNNGVALGQVGSAGTATSGQGGTGTPGTSTVTMQDTGLDVVNASGVNIRRAIMTGAEGLDRSFIDQDKLYATFGIVPIARISDNVIQYQMQGGPPVYMADVNDMRMIIQPPLDDRSMVCRVTLQFIEDFVLSTDQFSAANQSDATPLKRGVVFEYGNPT